MPRPTIIQRNRTRSQLTNTKQREARTAVADGESAAPAGLPLLRTSERGTFKRCRWKWWMEFEEVLKPKTDIPPLRFGSLIHKALADYYKPGLKRGVHPARAFAKHYEAELREQEAFGFKVADLEGDETWAEAGDLGEAMLTHYVDHYGADDEWEVLVTEQAFRTLVYRPDSYDPNHPPEAQDAVPWFWYVGILDGIWRNRRSKKLHIVDHKTAKAISLMYLSLDAQASAYWTFGLDWIYEKGLLKPEEKLAGMLYNHLRKAFPDERPYEIVDGRRVHLNTDGTYSKRQPAAYFVRTPIYRDWNDREQARVQAEAEFADIEALRDLGERDGTSPPPDEAYKNQGQFTCPGCWCFDFCELHEMGADWNEMRDLVSREWNPYAEHEVYADETH